jgi:HlyD family type I secretion membrane fusion protein
MSIGERISDLWWNIRNKSRQAHADDASETSLALSGDDAQVPVDPTKAIRFGVLVILITFGGFGGWAATARLNSAVIAPGEVTVFSSRKKIQHLDGGIVKEILVQNGDEVKANQVLMRLDRTHAGADMGRVEGQYDQARATVARLVAERDGADEISFPDDILERRENEAVEDLIKGQESLFQARRQSVEGQQKLIKEQITQLKEEIKGFEAQRRARNQQIETIRQELKDKQYLHEKGWVSRTDIMALERQRSQYQGDIGDLTARVANARARIGEAELQLLQVTKNVREQVVSELRQRQTEMYDLAETFEKFKFSLDHTEVRASHDGIVVNKLATSIGEVVRPGDLLMEIVPVNEKLIIEAMVNPSDRNELIEGLDADVQITAFKTRSTKKLRGKVIYVSADALKDEQRNLSYFKVRVEVSEEELKVLSDDQRLQPGMPATVFIQTGSRTPLAYLMQPINDSISHAWRET